MLLLTKIFFFLVSHHPIIWGTWIAILIFDFRVLKGLHIIGYKESKNHEIEMVSVHSLVFVDDTSRMNCRKEIENS